MKYYAGIGSRSTPKDIQAKMTIISGVLYHMGYTLRSGGAIGADTAFALGTPNAQIWFAEKKDIVNGFSHHDNRVLDDDDRDAYNSVCQFHPRYDKLSEYSIKLHSRNYRQIMGLNEPNSLFVICWTGGGLEKAGTAQALRIAKEYDIPVFNYYNMSTEEILKEIEKLEMLYD